MRTEQHSFEKFNYLLRPSKQVERKLIIETLLRLRTADYNISDYTYLGFGSVYYVDFILFHKYLQIDKMVCVEHAEIPKRMRFNKPFPFIQLRMSSVDQVVPGLPRRKPFLVWLDYDMALQDSILEDVDGFLQQLAPKSILLITVEARAKIPEELDDLGWSKSTRDKETLKYYNSSFAPLVGRSISPHELRSESRFRILLVHILKGKIQQAMLCRAGLEFIPIFNFCYADNAPMLTIGGIIEKEGSGGQLWRDHLGKLDFVNRGVEPVHISAPPLTIRERHWLDRRISRGELSRDPPFELEQEMLDAYSRYSRHCPEYREVLI